MFSKKCPRCKNKIDKKYRFCPFCGHNLNLKSDEDDYGLLGRDDFDDSFESMFENLPMSKLFKTAMKMTEKMMKNIQESPSQKESPNFPNTNVQFFINGKRVFPQKNPAQNKQSPPSKKIIQKVSKEKAEQFARLPRTEPKSIMKRLGGKLIYEIKVPGVQDIQDVFITPLENSIEVKAISKNKVYSKILNINLPIISYELDGANLILELQAR